MSTETRDIASLFVRRPVLALVFSLLIMIAGAAAFLGVPVRELPDVDRPVISVRTTYEGAAPETVDTQVTSVIEGAVSRVSGVVSISSSSNYGSSRVTIEFDDSADLNVAASDIRDAVGSVQRRLPEDVEAPTIVKADADGQPIIQLSVTSDTMTIETLTTLVDDTIVDRLSAVEGVAEVQAFGDQEQIVRVTIDATALAARGLGIADLEAALQDVALDAPAGNLRSGAQTLLVRANAGAKSAEEIAQTYLNATTRVSDVADVRFGPADQTTALRSNGQTGIGIGIIRQAESNTLNISEGVRAALETLRSDIPEDVRIEVTSDDAVFIDGAVREVVLSLILATAIVVALIYLFLRSVRATLIPAATVPICIVGTIAAVWMLGFSLNILTLLALVLATGMVVDDAIVVLENIVRRRAQGMGPRAAAVLGTREVFFAVIATTATLAAVFVPISFLPGTAGRLFMEFGYVMAIAVTLSSVVALTLCPMMASRLLTDEALSLGADQRPRHRWSPGRALDMLGRTGASLYARILDWCFKAPIVVLAAAVLFALFSVGVFRALPEELTPPEDRGLIFLTVSAPQGASLDYTEGKVREVEAVVSPLVDSGEATNVFSIVGRGGSLNRAYVTVPLVHWDARERSQAEITADIDEGLNRIVGVQISSRTPNSLGIRGGGQGLQFALTGANYDRIAEAADDFVKTLQTDLPRLENPQLSYDTTQPQLSVNIDRERASDLGISVATVSTALQTMLDGRQAGELYVDDDALPIEMRSPDGTINDPADLENLFVKAGDGKLVPLSSLVSIEEVAVAPSLRREEQVRSVSMMAGLGEDYDLRQAMTDLEVLAAEALPDDIGLIFRGEAATLDETSGGVALTFGFAVLVILLVLAAQFESFVSALIIMVTVPFGLGAAVFAMMMSGGSLNLYSQIGLVMLVGLMAKNGILIVEFANQRRDEGLAVLDAIREACRVRFRPVMMTMISTVLGGVPLVLSTGPGAEAREALGWIVVGGLGVSTLFTLFLTPVAFLLLAGLAKPRASEEQRLKRELAEAERRGVAEA